MRPFPSPHFRFPSRSRKSCPLRDDRSAFSLIELLAAIAIIILLMVFLIPAITGIKGGRDVTSTASGIAGIFDQARAYAMANNTYVWVGIAETDVSKLPSANPQTVGVGRVAVAVVASRDGTRGYDASNGTLGSPSCWANYNLGSNLIAISKLQYFDNIHLAPLFSTLPNSGGLARPSVSSATYMIGNSASTSVTPFDWPLGSTIGAGQYSFTKVINFDPQGVARIQTTGNQDGIVTYMEIGLIPTHGNSAPATTPANVAAIQIDGMTGATRIYRP